MKKSLYLFIAVAMMASCAKQSHTTTVCFEGNDSVLTSIEEWKKTPILDDIDGEDRPILAYLNIQIDTLEIQPHYITLHKYVEGCYEGAAHGFHLEEGITFKSSSTEPLGWKNILDNMPMDSVVRITNDLLREQNPDIIFFGGGKQPLPQSRPYMVNDTIVLVYQEYEIAPYACGIIKVKVPICK